MKLLTVTFILLCSIIWMEKIACQDYTSGTGGTAISGSGTDGTTGTGTGSATGVDSNSDGEGCDEDSSETENFQPSRQGRPDGPGRRGPPGQNGRISQGKRKNGGRNNQNGGGQTFGKFSKKRHGENKNENSKRLSRPRHGD